MKDNNQNEVPTFEQWFSQQEKRFDYFNRNSRPLNDFFKKYAMFEYRELFPDDNGKAAGVEIDLKDQNGDYINFGDELEVCVFLVSPANPDYDVYFRGVVIWHEAKVCISITDFKNNSDDWKSLSDGRPTAFPFDWDCVSDGTFEIPLYDLVSISGNLGDYNHENVEIIKRNPARTQTPDNTELLERMAEALGEAMDYLPHSTYDREYVTKLLSEYNSITKK